MKHCPHCGAPCSAGTEPFACPACGEKILPGSPGVQVLTYESDNFPARAALRRVSAGALHSGLSFAPFGSGWIVTACRTQARDMEIPAEYREKPVIAVGERAFIGQSVEHVHLPPTVRLLEKEAFADCRMLKEITGGDGLETIGSGCFRNCFRLENVSFSTVPSADITAFSGCYALGLMHENVHYGRNR